MKCQNKSDSSFTTKIKFVSQFGFMSLYLLLLKSSMAQVSSWTKSIFVKVKGHLEGQNPVS